MAVGTAAVERIAVEERVLRLDQARAAGDLRGWSRGFGSLRKEQGFQMCESENDANPVGRGGNQKRALQSGRVAVRLHQGTDAGRTEVVDAGEVEPQMVGALANHLLDRFFERLRPVIVEAARHLDVEEIARALLNDFHRDLL